MKFLKGRIGLSLLVASAVILTGCLISGVVVVDKMLYGIEFSTANGFYQYGIDVSDQSSWDDISDKLEQIEGIGFEIWFTNNTTATTFDVWLDDYDDPIATDVGDLDTDATIVLEDITVPAGTSYHSFAETLAAFQNVETVRDYILSGKFRYYGYSSVGGPGANYEIDSMRVVILVAAGTT